MTEEFLGRTDVSSTDMLRRILVLVVALAACGDDGARRLADAPVIPDSEIDAPIDAPIVPPEDLELGITTSGNGSGRITSSPAGIDCGATCTGSFVEGTMVTLTAEPDASSVFTGWGGACSGASPVCEVTISAATAVTATFTLKTYTVTVTKAGAGAGTVAGNGINCGTGAGCTITVDHGTAISLTATPVSLNTFVGWGGACTGTGTCDLTITADTTISAAFALDELSLIVTRGGNGAGTITSSPAGINCPGTCDFVFTANQVVSLTAAAAGSSNFTGWTGACTGMTTCNVTMDAAKTVTATFTLKTYVLDVTKTGSTGTGTVTSSPAGIACGSDCSETLNHGTSVTLTATPTVGTSTFTGWSGGGCTGAGMCVVNLTAATTVNAVFTINSYPLTSSVTGMGTITSSPAGVTCPGDCSQNYTHGTVVSFSQMANPGWTFQSWGGACSGNTTCSVTMDQARNVTATFTLNSYDLTVNVTGMGTVTASPQISCGTDCTGTYTHNTVVALTQMADPGWTFQSWGGACSGSTTCNVTMDGIKNVTALFTINSYALDVGFGGTGGSGTITATGIICPGDCSENFNHGTVVNVMQTPAADTDFVNWSGACTGSTTCSVTMNGARSVTANYALKQYNLDVIIVGTGTVTASPQINCPTDCVGTYSHGTSVTLLQSAGNGFQFTGWTGACTGMGTCSVPMTMAKTVTATFTPIVTLMVAKNGSGTGTVVSTPAGTINCGTDCSEAVLSGTSITLNATPTMPGSAFTGWSGGGCSSTGACTTTLTASTTVTATFDLTKHPLTVTATGLGKVDSTPAGISGCSSTGGTCMANFDYETLVTLTATPGGSGTTANELVAWGGACAGTPVTSNCTVTITAATSASATFALAPNIIFTTTNEYSASLGGLSGANAICMTEAGSLVGTGPKQNTKFIAFLSTPQVDFKTQLSGQGTNATGWRRPDGTPVFNRLGDLANNVVYYPPRWDATRDLAGPPVSQSAPRVWTGSNVDGTFSGGCAGVGTVPIWWGGSGISGQGTYGLASASSSMAVSTDTQNCATTTAHLLCLGIDRASSVDAAPVTGRLAFTSTANFNPNSMGIATADAICKSESTQAGLPGSYRALLAQEGASAISRFDTTGRTWVRVGDQQPIVRRASDLASDATKNLLTAPNVNAAGTLRLGKTINWSGSVSPMLPGPGVNCTDWFDSQGKSKSGYAGDTSLSVWWDYNVFSGQTCNQEFHKVICLQE